MSQWRIIAQDLLSETLVILLDVLHRDVNVLIILEHIVDAEQIWMGELIVDSEFLFQVLLIVDIGAVEAFWNDLDCSLLICIRFIFGILDAAKATAAQIVMHIVVCVDLVDLPHDLGKSCTPVRWIPESLLRFRLLCNHYIKCVIFLFFFFLLLRCSFVLPILAFFRLSL